MFTEVVAQVVFRSGRRDRLPSIEAAVNHVITELHGKQAWDNDLIEERVTPTFTSGANSDNTTLIWEEPKYFRRMQAIRCNGCCWLTNIKPSAGQGRYENFYYKTRDCYVLRCYQGISWADLAYYCRSPFLRCYPKGEEPARYDRTTEEWSYLQEDGTYGENAPTTVGVTQDEANEAAERLVGNWILQRWVEVVINGALARLYADIRDDRQRNQWSLYQAGIADMKRDEPHSNADD